MLPRVDIDGGFFASFISPIGLRMLVWVRIEIPESILDGVQGNTGDPNPPPSDDPVGVSTFRIEYWKRWGKLVLGKGSLFTVGVMGVPAPLTIVVGGAGALSVSGVSHISVTLSAVELVLLTLTSSVSLTELRTPPLLCLDKASFLVSKPHFFNTGSRYFLRSSPSSNRGKSMTGPLNFANPLPPRSSHCPVYASGEADQE